MWMGRRRKGRGKRSKIFRVNGKPRRPAGLEPAMRTAGVSTALLPVMGAGLFAFLAKYFPEPVDIFPNTGYTVKNSPNSGRKRRRKMKKWIAWFDELKGRLVFQHTDKFDSRLDAELKPRPYFHDDAIADAEKDSRKTLSLGQIDQDYPRAMATWQKAREEASLGKS